MGDQLSAGILNGQEVRVRIANDQGMKLKIDFSISSIPHLDLTDTENLESGSKELESEGECLIGWHNIRVMCDGPSFSFHFLLHTELQSAEHAVSDRHMAFVVCERVFNNLLAWAATRDVRYLLAAQRSLTAVQNQQGDA